MATWNRHRDLLSNTSTSGSTLISQTERPANVQVPDIFENRWRTDLGTPVPQQDLDSGLFKQNADRSNIYIDFNDVQDWRKATGGLNPTFINRPFTPPNETFIETNFTTSRQPAYDDNGLFSTGVGRVDRVGYDMPLNQFLDPTKEAAYDIQNVFRNWSAGAVSATKYERETLIPSDPFQRPSYPRDTSTGGIDWAGRGIAAPDTNALTAVYDPSQSTLNWGGFYQASGLDTPSVFDTPKFVPTETSSFDAAPSSNLTLTGTFVGSDLLSPEPAASSSSTNNGINWSSLGLQAPSTSSLNNVYDSSSPTLNWKDFGISAPEPLSTSFNSNSSYQASNLDFTGSFVSSNVPDLDLSFSNQSFESDDNFFAPSNNTVFSLGSTLADDIFGSNDSGLGLDFGGNDLALDLGGFDFFA